jgi:hypothetical protein
MAHHIGQHKGEPYYEEVREWLKTTYAKGGGVSGKKEWIAIYSRGNGQQIVVVKAKDKSEAGS